MSDSGADQWERVCSPVPGQAAVWGHARAFGRLFVRMLILSLVDGFVDVPISERAVDLCDLPQALPSS